MGYTVRDDDRGLRVGTDIKKNGKKGVKGMGKKET